MSSPAWIPYVDRPSRASRPRNRLRHLHRISVRAASILRFGKLKWAPRTQISWTGPDAVEMLCSCRTTPFWLTSRRGSPGWITLKRWPWADRGPWDVLGLTATGIWPSITAVRSRRIRSETSAGPGKCRRLAAGAGGGVQRRCMVTDRWAARRHPLPRSRPSGPGTG
jgi:hypothetical protein